MHGATCVAAHASRASFLDDRAVLARWIQSPEYRAFILASRASADRPIAQCAASLGEAAVAAYLQICRELSAGVAA